MERFIEKYGYKLLAVFGLIFAVSIMIGLTGCGQGSLPVNNKNQVDATNNVANAINDKNVSTVVNNDINTTVYPPSVDVNNTVYPPAVDINNTVYPPEVNTTVDINNTVVIQYNDIVLPVWGTGAFDDPYDLRQAYYTGISQESWFFSWLPDANCTIVMYSPVTVMHVEALDGELMPIDANCTGQRCSFIVSEGGSFMLDLIFQGQNASVIFNSNCLKQPIYY